MSAMTRRMPMLIVGVLAIGLSATAAANEVADYCQQSLSSSSAPKNFDVAKFCGCVAEKTPAADRAITVTVMKASDEARAKGSRLDPATLPADQGKALEALRGAVAGCVQASGPTQTPAPTAGKATGMAAWSQLVGNTVAGRIDGKDYAEFYQPDGTVKTMEDSVLTSGKWALEGDRICFTYPGQGKECFTVEVAGDDVTFTEKAGKAYRLKILKGNPKNL